MQSLKLRLPPIDLTEGRVQERPIDAPGHVKQTFHVAFGHGTSVVVELFEEIGGTELLATLFVSGARAPRGNV